MQEQMAKTQAELESKTVEVTAAGGKVKVTANGAGDVLAIKIDKEVVDPDDVEFLEEMVLDAVQQAVEQGKALAQSEMTFGRQISVEETLAKIEAVTVDDLAELSDEYFVTECVAFAAIGDLGHLKVDRDRLSVG